MRTSGDVNAPYIRPQARELAGRFANAGNMFVQLISGPRKSGKSTLALQAAEIARVPLHVADGREAALPGTRWIIENWQRAREVARTSGKPCVLVFEGIETRRSWAQTVLKLWDADRRNSIPVKPVLIFGEIASVLEDLRENMPGCYEITRCPYWSFAECREAFGFTLDEYLFFGGIPGADSHAADTDAWRSYLYGNVMAPALSEEGRAPFGIMKQGLLEGYTALVMNFAPQELSYNSALAYLPDVKNTVTLARYLDYLHVMGIATGVEKFRPGIEAKKRSSPRVLPADVGIANAVTGKSMDDIARDRQLRGRLVDCAVGAHLLNMGKENGFEVFYWREGNRAVDFVAWDGQRATAIEVQSGQIKRLSGSGRFAARFPESDLLVVGDSFGSSISIEEFLSADSLPRLQPPARA